MPEPLTTEQRESLQVLHHASQRAMAAFDDDDRPWRLEDTAKRAEETLLSAMGYPPAWEEQMDREQSGTSLRDLARADGLQWCVANALRRIDVLTLEELAERSPEEVGAVRGIGPVRLQEIGGVLDEHGLAWAAAG
jgi:DNA integrity scanning protein DisA with diadenylate cyclase activity